MQDHQHQSAPADRQVLKRRGMTYGRPGLEGAMPSRLIQPERQHGSGRAVLVEWCPQRTKCIFELNAAIRTLSYETFCLPLQSKNALGKIHIRLCYGLLRPACEKDIASEWSAPLGLDQLGGSF